MKLGALCLAVTLTACGSASFSGSGGKGGKDADAKGKPGDASIVPANGGETPPLGHENAGEDDPTNDGAKDGGETAKGETPGKIDGAPADAVTKGSFTVWTEPNDPKPYEDYDIVIAVRLPTTVTSYSLGDLDGRLDGTDGYRQIIREGHDLRLDFKPGDARIRVPVPGSYSMVQDSISIRSTLLNESQEIKITF